MAGVGVNFGSIFVVALAPTFGAPALADSHSYWLPLAEQGDVEAQFKLGVMYDIGDGVQQDHAEAVRWYRLAAEQGEAERLAARFERSHVA